MVETPIATQGFDFDVHHGGVFMYNPLRYDNGTVLPIYIGITDFDELNSFLEKEIGSPFSGLYYTFPGKTLENGLLLLDNNDDVKVMYEISCWYGKIDIYVGHFHENLSEYLIEINDGNYEPNEFIDDKRETGEVTDDNKAFDNGKAKVDDTVVVDCDSESEFDSDYVGGESDSEHRQCLLILIIVKQGLIEAVKDIMPYAEHRQCSRHIYEGFRKQFSGVEFRSFFWAASKSSYPVLFDTIMDRIRAANPNAFKYLTEKNPKSWSRAFFEINRGCEAVENGFSECFNAVIVLFRHKPIITMLEAIRVIVMERMNIMRTLAKDWVGDIAPNIIKRLEWNKDQHIHWHAHFAGGFEFEVRQKNEAFKVDEQRRTCSCRMWQLSGLPCPHACAVIFKLAKSPEDYIPAWFRKEMYMKAYTTYLRPVGGMTTWVPNKLNKPLPPPIRKMPGRPKKKRRRAAHEGGTGVRISKAGSVITCKICFQVGHNKRGCKNTPKEKPVKVSNPVGRPRNDGRPSGAGLSGQTVGGGAQEVGDGAQQVSGGSQSVGGGTRQVKSASSVSQYAGGNARSVGETRRSASTYGLKGGPKSISKESTRNVSTANATQNDNVSTRVNYE